MQFSTDIKGALADATDAYQRANPLSRARNDEAARSMPGGNTRTVLHYAPFPLAFVAGSGATLKSVDGATYIDFLGEFTAGLYGHSNPVILEAIHKALDNGISFGGHNMVEGRLAALIVDRFASIDLVRFANSGTEANLLALATATAVTGRRKVMVFNGGYHGSILTFAAGGSPINAPYEFVLAGYNRVDETRSLLRNHGESLAAVLIEPMLGTGGSLPASAEFMAMLREETTRSGSVLIFDEVMTSRISPGGMQEVYGIAPDLTTLGKYLGGGMSFGAFGGRRDLMEHFDPTRQGSWPHAGTFNNNILSMTAGATGLEKVFTPEQCILLNQRGEDLRHGLNALFEKAGVAMQATGRGSLMTVHATSGSLTTRADIAPSNEDVKELFFFDLLAEGIWLARRCMIALSLSITYADCGHLLGAVARFLENRQDLLPKRN